MSVTNIDSAALFDKITGDPEANLVVVDFHAKWCRPCKKIAPRIAQLAEECEKYGIVFAKADVDDLDDLSSEYNIDAMPTFVFFKDGKEIYRVEGAHFDRITKFVAQFKE
jgi:thioredoxin 1